MPSIAAIQRRPRRLALRRIERCLAQSDPQLEKLFLIFTRLAGEERLPGTERIRFLRLPKLLARCRLGRAARGRVRAGTTWRSYIVLGIALALMGALFVALGRSEAAQGPCPAPVARPVPMPSRACPAAARWPAGK
jgi:hypothetical protein